ncbi:hypothetical protein ACHAWU_000435 [Discostella pseudostelligera]|uniref:Large ribosomal subunit protein mL59 domain-containing protein n=1 Tax=Discostella pseudostelligera TaxID=259834 RepID=A0ABD3M176_9STRA
MRAALRQLCRHGIEALRPQKVNDKVWRKPAVSKRVAADLRKLALRNGTYGKFDVELGVGWDPAWDTPDRPKKIMHQMDLAGDAASSSTLIDNILQIGSNKGAIESIRPPKEHKRDRTRESRAQKIEALVAQADEKIEEYRLEMEGKKPKPGIEEEFKRAVKGSSW